MIDYSLPVARRTRQGQALIFKQYNEHKKGKENNVAESASSSGHSKANCKIETESETVAVSDSSVEEIGVNDWGEEGSDVGVESMGLKNNQKSNVGFERMDQVKEEILADSEDDEVVFLGEGAGAERDEGIVCIDVDDEDVLSGEDVNDPSGLNSDGGGERDESVVCIDVDNEDVLSGEDVNDSSGLNSDGGGDYVLVDSDGSETSWESSFGEEGSDDEDYKVDKLESCGESSSYEEASDEDSSDEEDAEGREMMKRGIRKRGRPKKGLDLGMKRRKYGLDILFDAENEEDDINDGLYCVARRTRSHFTAKLGKKKKKIDIGTFSHPLCVDEEQVKSSSGHDDSDDSDDIVSSDKSESDYENEDNFSDDETNHGGKKVQKVHVRDEGKLRMATKGKSIHLVKKGDALKILVNSILEKGEVPLEELESFEDDACKDENNSSVAKMALPLKFNFGVEESKPSKKSKDQTEMDELWAEFESSKDDACKDENNSSVAKMALPLKFNLGVEESKPSKKSKDQTEIDELWAELVSSKDDACKDENYSSVAKMPLPLKFTFGVEESNPLKKSEDQKETDELWADFELALICSEIGSAVSAKVEDEDALPPKNDVDRATRCQVGNHEFILDEQVGLRCSFCSYVKMEIKYILPSFCTYPYGKSDRRDPGSEMNHSIFDDLRPQDSGCDSPSVCDRPHAEATVWDIIPGIKNSMYPHQRDGFEFIWKNIAGGIYLDKLKNQTTTSGGSGCIISHAPGTGKTRLTIIFLQTYMKLHPKCRPVILAPPNILLTWEEEFRKWKFDIPFHNLNQPKLSGKETLTEVMIAYRSKQGGYLSKYVIRALKIYSWKQNSSILGISYQLFGKLTGTGTGTALFRKDLLEAPGLVVLDEGHIPRNVLSRILKALSNIKTDKRIILSGTPFQNNFDELYNTLCLVRPKFTSIRGKWESLTSPITKGTNDRLKCENLKKVRDMIDPFVHVHKGSILQEKLPGLRDSLVILQPTQLQKSLFGELHQHITRYHLNHFKSDFLNSSISVHPSLLLKCGEEGFPSERDKLEGLNHEAGVKTNFLLELIRLSNALNEKVLVFSQYLEPLTFVMDQLKFHFNWTEGNEVLYMDGKQEAKRRQSSINIFNDTTSEARVLLASIRACNEGISLVGASRVVLLDVVWNPSVETQAISRAYRLGQEKVVHVYHLIAAGTNEEDKYCRQVEKDLLSELVFSSSGGSGDQPKISHLVSDDKILEEMVQHEKLKHIFEKIQQKKSRLM